MPRFVQIVGKGIDSEGENQYNIHSLLRKLLFKKTKQEGNTFMKKLKKLLVLACLCCAGYGLGMWVKTDRARDTLFSLLGEDLYLAIQDKVYLLGDLLMWPIDFVRALLP